MNQETFAAVSQYIDAHREDILRDLMRLARVPSVRSAAAENAPFGPACAAAVHESLEIFKEAGFETEEHAASGYGMAFFGSRDKNIGLFGHADVVPVKPEEWVVTAPFEPKIVNDDLVGRGVRDNKSGIVASLYAAKAIRDLGIDLGGCGILCCVGSDEESGMEDMIRFAKEQPMPTFSFVPDYAYPAVTREIGMCGFDAVCKTPYAIQKHVIRSLVGGEAGNAVLGKLTVNMVRDDCLEIELRKALRGKEEMYTLEKDIYNMTLTVNGVSKHSSNPEGAVCGTQVAMAALLACPHLGDPDRVICRFLQEATSNFYGEQWGLGSTDKFYGKLTLVNALLSMTPDGHQKATFALRYGTQSDIDATVAACRAIFEENGWEIVATRINKGFSFEEDHPMVQMAKEVYAEIAGREEPTVQGLGGTYARKLQNAFGVGSAVFYLPKSYDLPAGHGGSHQPDESIRIAALLETIKILTMYVIEGAKRI